LLAAKVAMRDSLRAWPEFDRVTLWSR